MLFLFIYGSRWRSVGLGKEQLELKPENKTIAFKVNKWRLYSCQCGIICRSYQRLQCVFLKRYCSRKTVKYPPRTRPLPTTSLRDDDTFYTWLKLNTRHWCGNWGNYCWQWLLDSNLFRNNLLSLLDLVTAGKCTEDINNRNGLRFVTSLLI